MKTTINLPQNDVPNVDGTKFEGSSYFNIIGMHYLSHKPSNNVCVIWGEPYQSDHHKTTSPQHKHDESCVKLPKKINNIPSQQTSVSLRWIEGKNGKDSYISVPKPEKKFWDNFLNCTNKRFIALPFGFNCNDFGHANYLLFDKKKKTLERFESFGKVDSECISDEEIDSKLKKLFEQNLQNTEYANFTYMKPLEILPEDNVQTIQEEEKRWKNRSKKNPVGFCSVWSLWYIDLRTSNPDVEPKKLIKEAIKEIRTREGKSGSFTDFIRRYSLLFVEEMEKIEDLYDGNQKSSEDGSCGCNNNIIIDGKKKRRSRSRRKKSDGRKRSIKRSPANKALYEKAKKEVYSHYKKPSAFRSGALVKRYKELGGTYMGAKKSAKVGLTRWFQEKWGDVGHKGYPVFRPSRRVSKATPLLAKEIDPRQLKRQISLKQRIKGSWNLPKFLRKK
jgi:hypothetical protein